MIHPTEIIREIEWRLAAYGEFRDAGHQELYSLKTYIESLMNTRLNEMAAAMPTKHIDEHDTLPLLREGQCPRYREHGLNCGQLVDHEGHCKNIGPFAIKSSS